MLVFISFPDVLTLLPPVTGVTSCFTHVTRLIKALYKMVISAPCLCSWTKAVFTLGRNMISLITNETCSVVSEKCSHQTLHCANHG